GTGGDGTLAAPTFSPASGAYSAAQNVSLVLPTGATGCYTVDGSTPAASSAGTCSAGSTYSSTISVSANTTINALATEAGWTNSPVASGVYTINSSSYSDNFARANGSLGANWSEAYGSNAGLQISNDAVYAASAPAEHALDIYTGGTFSNNQWTSFVLGNGPGSQPSLQAAIVRGSTTTANWYNDGVGVGGTFANLGNGAYYDFCLVNGIAKYAKGDTHELDVAGSGPVFFWSKHNGVVDATCVDTALNYTGGEPGLGVIEGNSTPTVSDTTWQGGSLPNFSTTATDNFTRANAGWLGVNWWFNEPGGAGDSSEAFFILQNNAAVISVPNQWGLAVWTTPFNQNQASAMSVGKIASGDIVGPVVRYSLPVAQNPSSDSFYMIFGSSSGLQLYAYNKGNWALLKNYGSFSGTISTMELDATGTSPVVLTLKVNGTQFGTTYSDSTYKFAGLYTGFALGAGATQTTTITAWTGSNL
ncbi:MAG: chitobiase/beta-hexosaminidase C-terminal domain-containing protein, partial [Acidobacteriaceae bacterium]